MWENPPTDRHSLIGLIKSAYEGATLPGDVLSGKTSIVGPDGHTSDEVISRAMDLAQVYPLHGAPGGVFGRVIKDRVANPLLTTERALSDEATAAARGTIAATVPPATPRQVLAQASERQGVPIPRAGPQPPARPPDKPVAQSDRMTSGARESGPFDSGVPRADAATPSGRAAAESGGATFGSAGSKYYRTTFFKQNPKLGGKVFVHHAVEQQAQKKYPGVVTDDEMHSLENLRGIPRHLNSELHLRQIRREWDRFYKQNPIATRRQLLQKAAEIDARYGSQFNPPIKPGR